MERAERLFLEAFGASLKGESVNWEGPLTDEEWAALFELAGQHHVLPMIYEAAAHCPAARSGSAAGIAGASSEGANEKDAAAPRVLAAWKMQAFGMVVLQTQKTAEFIAVYRALRTAGLHPLVVKGLVCRALYPKPDLRVSGDEDILIPPEEFIKCQEVLLAQGLVPADSGQETETAHEVSYCRPGSSIYIELHKFLFPPREDAYGDFNRFFSDAHARAVSITIEGEEILTLAPTDHLLYLICHAFKHFLHSGVGIRQAADIAVFANCYGKSEGIDWHRLLCVCREIHADLFAAAIFQIGRKYLGFDPEAAAFPPEWREIQVDGTALLEDLLDAGVYGDSSMSRKHSSTMTLHAVSAEKQGRRAGAGGGLLHTLFPSARELAGRYGYLEKYPVLLPAAWISRILHYRRETAAVKKQRTAMKKSVAEKNQHAELGESSGKLDGRRTHPVRESDSAAESIRIGNRRIELLKEYGVLR